MKSKVRPGKTTNRSVSFSKDTLELLQAHADRAHEGNLSAAIADAARLLTMQAARDSLAREHDELFGPLTDAQRAAIDREQQGLALTNKQRESIRANPTKKKRAA